MQKHFSLFFFFSLPLKNCHFSCSKQTRRIVPATRLPLTSRQNPARESPLPARCQPRPATTEHPGSQEKGVLAPGKRRKLGSSWVCGAGSGVAGRCGAGTEPIAAVSPPASSRFISSPLGCRPGERGGDKKEKKKSSFILKNGLAPSCTELKAARLKSWQRRGERRPVPGGPGFGVHRSRPSLHAKPRRGR